MAGELVNYARLRSGLVAISLREVDLPALAQLAVAIPRTAQSTSSGSG